MLATFITHALVGLVCGGGGWWLKGKYGVKAGAIVTDIQKTVSDAKK